MSPEDQGISSIVWSAKSLSIIPGYSSSSISDSSEDPTFVWPEDTVRDSKSKVHTGYWSASDLEDERDPLLKHPDNDPILISQLSDT